MVRRLIAIVSLFCLAAVPQSWGQTLKAAHPNEICASYGVSLLGVSAGTVAGFANLLGDVADLLEISSGDNIRVRIGGSRGIATLGYSYTLNKTWQFGAAAGFSRLSVELSDKTGAFRPLTASLFNFMNTAQVNWFRTRNDVFGMYSKAGIGMWIARYGLMVDTADEMTGTKIFPAAHLSAVCLEVGKQVSGFLELGVGMQGLVQTGLRARF